MTETAAAAARHKILKVTQRYFHTDENASEDMDLLYIAEPVTQCLGLLNNKSTLILLLYCFEGFHRKHFKMKRSIQILSTIISEGIGPILENSLYFTQLLVLETFLLETPDSLFSSSQAGI